LEVADFSLDTPIVFTPRQRLLMQTLADCGDINEIYMNLEQLLGKNSDNLII
jgi:hypothetical protein